MSPLVYLQKLWKTEMIVKCMENAKIMLFHSMGNLKKKKIIVNIFHWFGGGNLGGSFLFFLFCFGLLIYCVVSQQSLTPRTSFKLTNYVYTASCTKDIECKWLLTLH